MDKKIIHLIKLSREAIQYSYSPYSGFKVGVALSSKDGKIYTGSNIECASYSLTICAERVAFAKALSEGQKDFNRIAITTNRNKIFFPCGACLQFMIEFSKDLKLILAKSQRKYKIYNIKNLLPINFSF